MRTNLRTSQVDRLFLTSDGPVGHDSRNILYSQCPVKVVTAAHFSSLIAEEVLTQPCMEVQALLPENLLCIVITGIIIN